VESRAAAPVGRWKRSISRNNSGRVGAVHLRSASLSAQRPAVSSGAAPASRARLGTSPEATAFQTRPRARSSTCLPSSTGLPPRIPNSSRPRSDSRISRWMKRAWSTPKKSEDTPPALSISVLTPAGTSTTSPPPTSARSRACSSIASPTARSTTITATPSA
jgi:hypothetical protein